MWEKFKGAGWQRWKSKVHISKCRLFWDEGGSGYSGFSLIQMTEKWPYFWCHKGVIFMRYRQHLVHTWLIYDRNSPDVSVWYNLSSSNIIFPQIQIVLILLGGRKSRKLCTFSTFLGHFFILFASIRTFKYDINMFSQILDVRWLLPF